MNNRRKMYVAGILGVTCLVVLLAVFVANLRMNSKATSDAVAVSDVIALNKDTSYSLGTEQNPFVVLEIVPNRSLAEVGYLIGGCEPVDMKRLAYDTQISIYESRFCSSSKIASIQETSVTVCVDEIPAGEIVNNWYWEHAPEYKDMFAEGVILGGEWNNYGTWKVENNSSGIVQGYYKRVADKKGTFKLEENENDGYFFSYVGKTGGDYVWITAENTKGIETDYLADQVWTMRTGEWQVYTLKMREIIHNNDLIQKVFGTDDVVSKVITAVPEDFNNEINLDLIRQADMIYIHGSHDSGLVNMWKQLNKESLQLTKEELNKTTFTKNDLPWSAAVAIVDRMASANRAALILDGASMYNQGNGTDNMHKLYIMLMQYGPKLFKELFLDTGLVTQSTTISNGVYTGVYQANGSSSQITKWDQKTFWPNIPNTALEYLIAAGVYNPYITEGESGWNMVVDGIFTYKGDMSMLDGYLSTTVEQHKYNGEAFDYYAEYYGETPDKLTPNEVLRYILLGADYKKSLKILEVQPCNQFIYGNDGWELYYLSMFPWFEGDLRRDVTVTTMPTWQFIGSIEDLNADYDLIVFGVSQNASNGINGYYDSNLNTRGNNNPGLAYISVGDLVKASGSASSWKNVGNDGNLRYSGNDITEKKVKELKSFLNAGKPIVFDSGFFDGDSVNTNVIDKSSQIYQFASLYNKNSVDTNTANIFIRGKYESGDLKNALARETCKITFYKADGGDGYPAEYTYAENADGTISDVTYCTSRTFEYNFKINGKSGQKYGVNLYIDMNGDGIYDGSLKEPNVLDGSSNERIGELEIRNVDGTIVNSDNLVANTFYTITRKLENNYQGILPWKLEVYNVSNTNVRNSVIKYSALKTSYATRENIKVLQMNLKQNMDGGEAGGLDMAASNKFRKYLSCVDEFNVTIEFLKNADWCAKFAYTATDPQVRNAKVEAWKEYLDRYDMLILGFNDMCSFTSDDIFYEGFQYFVEQGKSLILSHDIAKDATFEVVDAASVSKYDTEIRDLMGQRRYKTNQVQLNGRLVSLLRSDGLYQKSQSGVVLPEYFDNSTRLYLTFGAQSKKDRDTAYGTGWSNEWRYTTYVNIANEGQITSYPYQIPDIIEVTRTHTQNFQLDLEDEGIVVWYCLTDKQSKAYQQELKNMLGAGYDVADGNLGRGLYSSVESDTRNSYYIYNKGNITYTGLGHLGKTEPPDDEVKLFVNTMISAYRATAARPKVEVTNEDVAVNGEENILYIPIDEENFSNAGDTLPVSFKVIDDSLIDIAGRDYTLQYLNEDGVPENQTTYKKDGKEQLEEANGTFSLDRNGEYCFHVSYQDVKNKGKVEYILVLNSSYVNAKNETITTTARIKVIVLPMPLFGLN